ncbi:hypothetical protein KM043_018464 [Ampulex compressa]|nr:hypothetical protein KM043_018464 [Ampulex compressa]
MKTLAIIGCLLVAASVVHGLTGVEKYVEVYAKPVDECAKEFNLTPDQKSRVINMPTWNEEDKKKMTCMTECVFKKIGAQEGKKLVQNKLYEITETVHKGNDKLIADLKKVVDRCRQEAETEANDCDVGYAFTNCYVPAYAAIMSCIEKTLHINIGLRKRGWSVVKSNSPTFANPIESFFSNCICNNFVAKEVQKRKFDMKVLLLVVCALLATVTVNADEGIEGYIKYLKEHLKACASEHGLTEDDLRKIADRSGDIDEKTASCVKACVMRQMDGLDGANVKLSSVYAMIEKVHEGDADEIARVKNLAKDCADEVNGITDTCELATKYTDCYIRKLM